jgi:hypothetical protein
MLVEVGHNGLSKWTAEQGGLILLAYRTASFYHSSMICCFSDSAQKTEQTLQF